MGFKAVKEHYGIGHIVAVYEKRDFGGPCICIGSPYIHDIIVIRISDAKVVKPYPRTDLTNADLTRYNEALKEDEQNGKLRKLIDTPDTFVATLPVYTICNWAVVQEYCEKYGWPNTTHTGAIMYENTYFQTRAEAFAYLLRDTKAALKYNRFWENMAEAYSKVKRVFRHTFRAYLFWAAARTAGCFIMKRSYGNKRT